MSYQKIKDCIKVGQKYSLSLTLQDDDGTLLDLTGWSGNLTLELEPQASFDAVILDGQVENQVTVEIPTSFTSGLEGSRLEGNLDLIGGDGETEFSFLIDYDVERRARAIDC